MSCWGAGHALNGAGATHRSEIAKKKQKCNIGKSLGGSGEKRWEGRVTRLLITYILCHWMQLCMQLLAPLTTLPPATS